MFQKNVFTFKNLPVEQKHRKWTDCCCTIITAIFALTLFVLSFVFFTRDNYFKVNFPVDDLGKVCAYDRPQAKLIYFQDPTNLSSGRHCVKSCPSTGEVLSCDKQNDEKAQKACASIGASGYNTQAVANRLGAFCMPTDQEMADKIWASDQLSEKHGLVNSYDVILLSLLFGLLLGIIYLIAVMIAPKLMTYAVFFLAALVLLAAGLTILLKPVNLFNPHFWNIILGVFLILFGLFLVVFFICYSHEIELSAIFMSHANIFLKETILVFGYIPLFLLFTAGLFVLFLWQYIAFGTFYQPYLANQGDLYYTSGMNWVLQILNIIELIWGLQFLRDAFNFVVSGNSVEWYFRNEAHTNDTHCCRPFTRLLCKNWGSVAGGSFLNAFFNLFDLISDFFRCEPKGTCGKCHSCYTTCCICDYCFELVRTDAYAYINLTGIPYCNAARQCQAECKYSHLFNSNQSCLRLYRIAAHVFLVALVVLICYAILSSRTAYISIWALVYIIFFAYCTVTYFIDIHCDAAEGLVVCYLTEENCEGTEMYVCPPSLRSDIYRYQCKSN